MNCVVRDIRKLLEAHRTVVVGVGEHAHGDEVSWTLRVGLMRRLADVSRMVVLCENLDFSVAALRRPDVSFAFFPASAGSPFVTFDPFLLAYSDRTRKQLRAAREIAGLCQRRVFGVDVQQLDFPGLPMERGTCVSRAYQRMRARRRWRDAPASEKRAGALRNRLNGECVAHIAEMQEPGTVILYFAHNEHVAKSCSESRRNARYATDGSVVLLRAARSAHAYYSVATFAPLLWNAWGESPGRQKLLKTRRGLGEGYEASDFDAALKKRTSSKLRFLTK